VGLAASTFFAPMIATTTAWFATQRSLAVSLVSAGMGVAPMTISPFARWLISTYDWRTAMLVIGLLAWVLLIPASQFVRQPPVPVAGQAASAAPEGGITSVAQALSSASPSSCAARRIPARSSTWSAMRCRVESRRWLR
jgi:MFS family permease